jgi:hypothetical protein
MKSRELKSPAVELVLRLLEPFPNHYKATEVREGSARATARLAVDDPVNLENSLPTWVNAHAVLNAYLPATFNNWDGKVELFKDGEFWKIYIPVTDRMRLAVDALREKGGNYKNSIHLVRDEVKNNPVTQSGLETELKQRLTEATGK